MINTIVFSNNSNIYIIKKKNLIKLVLLHKSFFYINCLNSKLIRIHWNLLALTIFNYNNQTITYNDLNKFFFLWDNFFTLKIRISGKGFKIKINGNQLYLMLNYSNFMLYQYLKVKCYKLEKHKFIYVFLTNRNKINLYRMINLRKLNPYTKRGIKQLTNRFFTKRGKITSN